MRVDETGMTERDDGRVRESVSPFLPPWAATVLIFGAIALTAILPFQTDNSASAWLPVALLLAAVALVFRDRFPLATVVTVVVIEAVATAVAYGSPATVLPVAIALFAYANRRDRRRTIIVGLATAVVLVGVALLGSNAQLLDARLVLLPVTFLAAAAAGDATRSRRAVLASITERAERAEEALAAEASRQVAEERLRIARDLHDVVAHQMTVINLHAGVARNAVGIDDTRAADSIDTIASAARTVLSEIGELLAVLRADGVEAPSSSFARVDDLVTEFRSLGLAVSRRTEGEPAPLIGPVDVVAFRVVQEALTNAHKHGAGGRASLDVRYADGWLTIAVENPARGVGGAAARQAGHGLIGMRERVESLHGTLETGRTATGFRVYARLPLREGAGRDTI